MAAGHAEAQMHPRGTDAQTVFTAVGAGRYVSDLIEMSAVHNVLLFGSAVRCAEGLLLSQIFRHLLLKSFRGYAPVSGIARKMNSAYRKATGLPPIGRHSREREHRL